MMYQILKVTISRNVEDMPAQSYSYATDCIVTDINKERAKMKRMYQADRVHFCYTQIPKDEIK